MGRLSSVIGLGMAVFILSGLEPKLDVLFRGFVQIILLL